MSWGKDVTALFAKKPDLSCCTFKCWFAAEAASPISVRGFGGGLDLPTKSAELLVPFSDDSELLDILVRTIMQFNYNTIDRHKHKMMTVPLSHNTVIIQLLSSVRNDRRRNSQYN